MTASILVLATAAVLAGPDERPRLIRHGRDDAPGVLANLTQGFRPWDPPDPSRPTVVFIHGFNPVPGVVHFTIAERLSEAVSRRGGRPVNVMAWQWNAATFVGLSPRVNAENNRAQGRRLAAALRASGVAPWAAHLIGHSAGGIVAASAARAMLAETGHPVAQVTLLDPAWSYHDVVFDELAVCSCARRVENYWAPGLSGYGRAAARAGVVDVRVDNPQALRGTVDPSRNSHLHTARWYLATVEDRAARAGYNVSVFAAGP